jgi:hypothetical protein
MKARKLLNYLRLDESYYTNYYDEEAVVKNVGEKILDLKGKELEEFVNKTRVELLEGEIGALLKLNHDNDVYLVGTLSDFYGYYAEFLVKDKDFNIDDIIEDDEDPYDAAIDYIADHSIKDIFSDRLNYLGKFRIGDESFLVFKHWNKKYPISIEEL